MAVSFGPTDEEDGDEAMLVAINTTPLVDVMLVLLIIFLIAVPVISAGIPVALPRNIAAPLQLAAETVTVSVDRQGQLYWNDTALAGPADLTTRLQHAATAEGKPAIQLRGDSDLPFSTIAEIMERCREAGVTKLGFVLQPD